MAINNQNIQNSGKGKAENDLEKKVGKMQSYTLELEKTRRALLNILEDVGEESKRAEKERDRTMAIIRNFADGLLLTEEDRIVFLNPKIKEFFNISEPEAIGRELWEFGRKSKISLLVKLLKKEGMDFSRKELALGAGRTLEVSAMPLLRGRQTVGSMIILHDITREKFVEQMKTEFVSIAAHQLRTPISAIKWILRMFIEGDLGKMSKTQKDYLQKAFISNERMIRLINDLLNVSRIEEGRFLYDIKKEDIIKVIEGALEPMEAAAQRQGIEFKFSKPDEAVPKPYVDAAKIALAVQNLVDNAIRYTTKGGVYISLSYLKDKKGFLVEIKDTGIGIPKEQQGRVFTRFFRASNAIRTETGGTGLGLFIAKNIIEAHQGRVWFESEPGQGSKFYFSLPIKSKAEFERFIEGF